MSKRQPRFSERFYYGWTPANVVSRVCSICKWQVYYTYVPNQANGNQAPNYFKRNEKIYMFYSLKSWFAEQKEKTLERVAVWETITQRADSRETDISYKMRMTSFGVGITLAIVLLVLVYGFFNGNPTANKICSAYFFDLVVLDISLESFLQRASVVCIYRKEHPVKEERLPQHTLEYHKFIFQTILRSFPLIVFAFGYVWYIYKMITAGVFLWSFCNLLLQLIAEIKS